ncbi:MAG: peptidoglycan endopeptidase [Variovorax sp.]|nr:MAG: peptidoglycan endopeptidase [Variovorax sp.]
MIARPAHPAPARRRFVQYLGAASAASLMAACTTTTRAPPSPRTIAYPTLTPEQSSDIAIHALGLVGTPYRYGGNTPDGGFDCSGLIGYVYRSRAGIAPPRTVAQLDGFGQPVSSSDLRTGDLVLFGGGRPFHAGIYVGEGRFVHAPSTGGEVRLDRLAGVYWSKQALAVRRP